MELQFIRQQRLPQGRLARILFEDGELRALLSQSGCYYVATDDGTDFYAFSARLGLSPHPALSHLEGVRFYPEDSRVGQSGHDVVGVNEGEERFICPTFSKKLLLF